MPIQWPINRKHEHPITSKCNGSIRETELKKERLIRNSGRAFISLVQLPYLDTQMREETRELGPANYLRRQIARLGKNSGSGNQPLRYRSQSIEHIKILDGKGPKPFPPDQPVVKAADDLK